MIGVVTFLITLAAILVILLVDDNYFARGIALIALLIVSVTFVANLPISGTKDMTNSDVETMVEKCEAHLPRDLHCKVEFYASPDLDKEE